MHSWIFFFTLWIIIQYCFIHHISQIVPTLAIGSSSSLFLCLFEIALSLWAFFFFFFMMGFLKHALTFWHHQVLQTHVCLAPVLDSSIFPRSPGLLLENGVGIQDWSLGVLMITRMSWLLGLLS